MQVQPWKPRASKWKGLMAVLRDDKVTCCVDLIVLVMDKNDKVL